MALWAWWPHTNLIQVRSVVNDFITVTEQPASHNLAPCSTSHSTAFNTRHFFVKYVDESVEIAESALFEFDAPIHIQDDHYTTSDYVITLDVMHVKKSEAKHIRVSSTNIMVHGGLRQTIYGDCVLCAGMNTIEVVMATCPAGLRRASRSAPPTDSNSLAMDPDELKSLVPAQTSSYYSISGVADRLARDSRLCIVTEMSLDMEIQDWLRRRTTDILNNMSGVVSRITGGVPGASAEGNASAILETIVSVWLRVCDVLMTCRGDIYNVLQQERTVTMTQWMSTAVTSRNVLVHDMARDMSPGTAADSASVTLTTPSVPLRDLHMEMSEEHKRTMPAPLDVVCPCDPRVLLIRETAAYDMDPICTDDVAVDMCDGVHLLVCVHGLAGSSTDLSLWRSRLMMSQPSVVVLMSEANENTTFGDITHSGQALAQEITHFVQKRSLVVSKLSFICHSLGGVITRSALTEELMVPYLPKLFTFVSLSVPHLGTSMMKNPLVSSVLCMLRTCWRSAGMQQLCYKDAPKLENTFLYTLALHDELHKFKNLIIVSSPQDKYVPYYSARMEIPVSLKLSTESRYSTVAHLIWDKIISRRCNVIKLDVVHDIDQSFLGREAHILMLDSDCLVAAFYQECGKYFV